MIQSHVWLGRHHSATEGMLSQWLARILFVRHFGDGDVVGEVVVVYCREADFENDNGDRKTKGRS